jgi:hypothetical protein
MNRYEIALGKKPEPKLEERTYKVDLFENKEISKLNRQYANFNPGDSMKSLPGLRGIKNE